MESLFAKFIAHVQADGCYSKKTNAIRYFNKDLNLITQFNEMVMGIFGIKPWKTHKAKTSYETGFRNKNICALLFGFKFGSIDWEVPGFVKNGSEKVKSGYLQAFFDDEGSIVFRKRKWGFDREVKMMLINKNGLF